MESRMKTLCSALLECMILPLQDKLEEWRKNVGILDKEHNKEYKKVVISNYISLSHLFIPIISIIKTLKYDTLFFIFQLRAEVKKKWEVSNRLKKKNSKSQKANSSSADQLQKVLIERRFAIIKTILTMF